MNHAKTLALCSSVLAALVIAACGGGGGTSGSPPAGAGVSGATAGAMSSGTISAFGSVFVNGHEFATGSATLVDDDDDSRSTDMSRLEVGMSVDVKASSRSRRDAPDADEIHLHPLARGNVDAADSTASTLTVLGQTVQLTASTNYSDHRACVTAATTPCTAVTGQSGLVATSGTGATAVGGSYVTVYGYLFNAGTATSTTNIVATLVAVDDAPAAAAATGVNYKVEGVVTATSATGITIGGLAVDLAGATCKVRHATTACATAFAVGDVVSAFSAAAPTLPATNLTASGARARNKLVVETAGATVELEGKVASVTTTPAGFVLRGVSIDTSALTGFTAPGVGDVVRVLGTVATDGKSVTATSVTTLHLARSSTYGFEGDAGTVVAGTAADTWVLTVLGQDVTVNATTRLADRSVHGRRSGHSDGDSSKNASGNPFNVTTFKSYLDASTSKHLLVRTQVDTTGKLTALAVTIVPASTVASVSGVVDATPAPVISAATGTPTTFSLHGLAVSADPAAIVMKRVTLSAPPLAAGDFVLVRGTFAGGTLSVAAPASPVKLSASNIVIDFGPPSSDDHDCF
jgi:hypothetical protein